MDLIKNHKKIILGGVIGLILLAYAISLAAPDKVPAYSVAKTDYVPSLLLSGEVVAEGSATLSSLTGGTVLNCAVLEGQQVKQGQLLVQIDDQQARLARDRAAAAVKIARAQLQKASTVTYTEAQTRSVQAEIDLQKAQQEYDRIQSLVNAGAASAVELEQAERALRLGKENAASARTAMEAVGAGGSSIAILQAELRQKELDLADQEIRVKQMQILAPSDGVLLDLYVSPGETLTASSPITLVAAGSSLRIKIQPDQRYANLAKLGNQAKVWASNQPEMKWDARVVSNEPVANAEQGSFVAELELNQPTSKIYTGQLVSVQLFGPSQLGSILIPDKYLTVREGKSGVWLARNGHAKYQNIKSGLMSNDGVVIEEGLAPGDIILQPDGLKDNQPVSPQVTED